MVLILLQNLLFINLFVYMYNVLYLDCEIVNGCQLVKCMNISCGLRQLFYEIIYPDGTSQCCADYMTGVKWCNLNFNYNG